MTKLVVIVGFLVAFAAGVIVGSSRQHAPVTASAPPQNTGNGGNGGGRGSRDSELHRLLNLRPDQQQAMKQIWSETADTGRKQHEERRRDLRRQRDEKIQSLLSAEQKAQFERAHEEYDEQTKSLEREMRANFDKSVEATKALLDPDQRAKYEEFLARRHWDRGPRGGPGGRERDSNGRRSDAGATSGPTTRP